MCKALAAVEVAAEQQPAWDSVLTEGPRQLQAPGGIFCWPLSKTRGIYCQTLPGPSSGNCWLLNCLIIITRHKLGISLKSPRLSCLREQIYCHSRAGSGFTWMHKLTQVVYIQPLSGAELQLFPPSCSPRVRASLPKPEAKRKSSTLAHSRVCLLG